MSLINDALKRARKNQSSGGTADGPTLLPVESGARKNGLLMPGLIILVLAVSGFFFWKWYHGGPPKTAANRPKPAATNQAAATGANKPATRSNPVQYAAAKIAATERVNGTLPSIKGSEPDPISDNPKAAPVASTAPATPTPSAPAPPAAPPEPSRDISSYKIQSIFYLPSKPCAVINSLTVFIGDKVDGARVVDIGKDWVSLATSDGQTNRLIIGSAK